ncbi:hypothetical protein AALP_AA6G160500 [Arabis alpina]|uniref:Reverse transcriptase domain-containing protein n=1 Tax=Arabis alpina TaxID=50452 RepID=A0A087GPJ8_ARAAL|nr:hypothetical protein AALP_AA6G160500 [Arabis alpina]
MVLEEGFVLERLSVEFPNGVDGEPEITIGEEVLTAMNGLWKRCMIVKVLGRNIPVAVLSKKLRELWKPQVSMFVMDLPRQFFMVRFGEEEEYLKALTGGPWKAFGSYLMARTWSPDFDPMKDEIATTPVWIRLSNIPVKFYHKTVLMGIAKGLGKPLKVDATTLNLERARFARVCVEVDLSRPRKGYVLINKERYYVSYEGLTNICSQCGIYGHTVHSCLKKVPLSEGNAMVPTENTKTKAPTQAEDEFTEVRRLSRRSGPPGQAAGRLGEDLSRSERREVVTTHLGDKENEDAGNGNIMDDNITSINAGRGEPVMVFGRKSASGAKGASKEKQMGNLRPAEVNGLKGKNKSYRPTRGLVFGPMQEDVNLLASGKRLRVKRAGVGRPGGMFARDGTENLTSQTPCQENNTEMFRVSSTTAAEGTSYAGISISGRDGAVRCITGVPRSPKSGGLWLLWRSSVGNVVILEAFDQFIHAKVGEGLESIHLVVVYAAPTVCRQSGLWEKLRDVIHGIDESVIVGGDFNTILRLDERTGGNDKLSLDSMAFGDWINGLSLIDMGFKGNKFTWRRGRMESTYIAKRLDRVLCNASARLRWQEASVTHLPFLSSDHTPLFIQLCPILVGNPRRRPFRFEAAWLKHESFQDMLKSSWNGGTSTPKALEELREKLKKRNREVFGDVQKRREQLVDEIKSVQDRLELTQTTVLLEREAWLLKEFEDVLEQEEVIWFQKSREKNIALGDRNTKYFNTSTIIRRRRNRIESLKDDTGPEPKWIPTGRLPEGMNDALVVLIAKVGKPEMMTQVRPISLCNVIFKTITKAMVIRMKKVMPNLIGPEQSSFIPGRLSADNIVVVQESVHSMRRKKGRKGWMLLKLDLEKAYDRIRWDFLQDTLEAARLPDEWVRWIKACVTGPTMNLLWNGEKSENIKPLRGIRQGDPLSPYLFVLCLERLCLLIDHSISLKEWIPISLSCGGPKLSHICFADDLILFPEASVTQIRVIRRVLERFCVASGQKVSLEKSNIFFSSNVSRDLEKLISDESIIKSTRELGKYLGMPVLQKRINKETFGDILEKVSSRLAVTMNGGNNIYLAGNGCVFRRVKVD